MPKKGGGPSDDLRRQLRQVGIAVTIPFLLLAAACVGLFLGLWLDNLLGTTPWLKIIGTILGFMAGARETYLLIRKLSRELEDDGPK
jgi:ATP synthase protein I